MAYTVWHTGQRSESVLPLEDEDAETRTEDGWKRINTLQHYNVQDNSTMHLVADRQRTNSVADGEPHVVRNVDGTLEYFVRLLSPLSKLADRAIYCG